MKRNINKIDGNCNLEITFTKLGFDHKSMLDNAKHVNNWTIVLSAESVFGGRQSGTEKIQFSFTVIRYGGEQEYFIHHIQASLLTSISNSNQTKVAISKHYWNYHEPFPSKEKICDDITTMLNTSSKSEGVKPA